MAWCGHRLQRRACPLPLSSPGTSPVFIPFPSRQSGCGPCLSGPWLNYSCAHAAFYMWPFASTTIFFPSDTVQLPALCLLMKQTHPRPHPANEAIRGISRRPCSSSTPGSPADSGDHRVCFQSSSQGRQQRTGTQPASPGRVLGRPRSLSEPSGHQSWKTGLAQRDSADGS